MTSSIGQCYDSLSWQAIGACGVASIGLFTLGCVYNDKLIEAISLVYHCCPQFAKDGIPLACPIYHANSTALIGICDEFTRKAHIDNIIALPNLFMGTIGGVATATASIMKYWDVLADRDVRRNKESASLLHQNPSRNHPKQQAAVDEV